MTLLLTLPSLDSVNYTLAILGIVGVILGWWSTAKKKAKVEQEEHEAELAKQAIERARREKADNAILGESEIRDASGAILQPAKPGLVARTATLEQAVGVLVDQDSRLKKIERIQARHESDHDTYDSTLAALIGATYERGSASALAAIEKLQAGTIDVEPD